MTEVRRSNRGKKFSGLMFAAETAAKQSLSMAQTLLVQSMEDPNLIPSTISEKSTAVEISADTNEDIGRGRKELPSKDKRNSNEHKHDKSSGQYDNTLDNLTSSVQNLHLRSSSTVHFPRANPQLDLHTFAMCPMLHSQISPLLPHKEVIFFDTETTGIFNSDRIIELAFVYRNYDTLQEKHWYALINPEGVRSNSRAYDAHKIPDAALTTQPPMRHFIREILDFLRDDTIPIVAHNAQFDRRMLNLELARLALPTLEKSRFLCTYQLAKRFNGQGKGVNSLSALCAQFDIDLTSRAACHGAMQDTLLLAEVFPHIVLLASQQ